MKNLFIVAAMVVLISCGKDDPSPQDNLIDQYKATMLGTWIPTDSVCQIMDHNSQFPFRGMRHVFTITDCTMTEYCFSIDQFGPKSYKFIAASNGEIHIEIYNVGRFVVKELDSSHLYFVSVNEFPAGSQFDLHLVRE